MIKEIEEYADACEGTIVVRSDHRLVVVVTPSALEGVNYDVKRYSVSCFNSQELAALRAKYRTVE
jgi:hypothetical protein